MKMTIGDVAEALGVSKTTVSRAISGKGRIGEKTREMVLNFIKEHNYTPSAIAKGLAQSRTFNISFVIPGDSAIVELPFFQNCLSGICESASNQEYDIIISMCNGSDISQLKRAVENHKIDGVILGRTFIDDIAVKYLKKAGIPFVVIGSANESGVVSVDNNHQGGCYELTDMLLTEGFNKLGLIGGSSEHTVTDRRLKGYILACKDRGYSYDEDMIYLDVLNQEMADNVVQEIIQKGADCIISMDDLICGYVINTLNKISIDLRPNIKLASFYNSPMLDMFKPRITALDFDSVELGREAFGILYNMIELQEVNENTLLGYEIRNYKEESNG